MQETTCTAFAFTNLTNLNLPSSDNSRGHNGQQAASVAAQKANIADKLKALVAHRALLDQKAASDGSSSEELIRRALFSGNPSSLRLLQNSASAPRGAGRPAALRKLNCGYFRGKKAVFKTSNIRISFEIVEKIN